MGPWCDVPKTGHLQSGIIPEVGNARATHVDGDWLGKLSFTFVAACQ